MQLPDWVLMCSARCLDRRESSCDLMGTWVFGSSHFLVRCCSLLPLLLEDQVEPDLSIFLPFLLENQEVDQFCLEREETSKLPPSLPPQIVVQNLLMYFFPDLELCSGNFA